MDLLAPDDRRDCLSGRVYHDNDDPLVVSVTADLSALLAKATPGPWEAEKAPLPGVSSKAGGVCVTIANLWASQEQENADKALIALAPVLAQACLDAETALATILGHDKHLNAVWQLGPGQSWREWHEAKNEARAALASLRAATGNSE
jgi:hypothetical protein